MSWLDSFASELENMKSQGLYNNIKEIQGPQGAWIKISGKMALNLCSNNYLGLANYPEIVKAAQQASEVFGAGPGAVRSIAGTQSLHLELESKLAAFKETEAALVLQSGFITNFAVVPTIVGKGDVIFSDELNHASIIDGCRLSGAQIVRYKHSDAGHLEEELKGYPNNESNGKRLIVSDGVFSMDGDIADLPSLVGLAKKYEAILMIDDAHGEGVLGKNGRGIVNYFGLEDKVDIEIGTLSKAFGVVGGFVCGKQLLIEYLRQKARPFIFSTGLSPADTAASFAAVDILLKDDSLIKHLWENTSYFKERIQSIGFNIGVTQTPIVPVMMGEADIAKTFSAKLLEKNVFAQSIAYPTVPKGKARIRVMISSCHEKPDLDFGLDAFCQVGSELGII